MVPFNVESATKTVQKMDELWRQQERRRRAEILCWVIVLLFLILVAGGSARVSPGDFVSGIPSFFNYVGETLPTLRFDSPAHFLEDVRRWQWGFQTWMGLIVETLLMAILATTLGFIAAFVFCVPASRNLVRNQWLVAVTRRVMEFHRTIPELVFALIFVFAFGIGPLAGVLAIALHSFGSLGKLFAEVNENVEDRALESVRASGGGWLMEIRYALLPQVMPNYASFTMLRFEMNVRAATVMGFVGAGGIGQQVMNSIRSAYYQDVSAIVIHIILLVMIIDWISSRLRHSLMGGTTL